MLVESQRGHGSCSCSGGGAPGFWGFVCLRCSLESEGIWVEFGCNLCDCPNKTTFLALFCFVLVFDLRVVDVNAELSRGIGRLVLVLVE